MISSLSCDRQKSFTFIVWKKLGLLTLTLLPIPDDDVTVPDLDELAVLARELYEADPVRMPEDANFFYGKIDWKIKWKNRLLENALKRIIVIRISVHMNIVRTLKVGCKSSRFGTCESCSYSGCTLISDGAFLLSKCISKDKWDGKKVHMLWSTAFGNSWFPYWLMKKQWMSVNFPWER